MTDFCCKKMKKNQKELKDKRLKDHSVIYDKIWRGFFIHFNEEKEQRDREMMADIYFCPWCGTKLPHNLADEWFDILSQEYNIIDPSVKDRHKVPLEFKTDEWWKKRGL